MYFTIVMIVSNRFRISASRQDKVSMCNCYLTKNEGLIYVQDGDRPAVNPIKELLS